MSITYFMRVPPAVAEVPVAPFSLSATNADGLTLTGRGTKIREKKFPAKCGAMCQPGRCSGRHCSIDDEGAAMRGIRRQPMTMLAAAASVAAIGAATALPAAATAATSTATATAAATKATSICTSAKHPYIAAKISAGISAALAGRPGSFVGLDAADAADGLTCQLHATSHFYAASVIKVTILSALLMKVGGPSHLTAAQRSLAVQMITQSSNSA